MIQFVIIKLFSILDNNIKYNYLVKEYAKIKNIETNNKLDTDNCNKIRENFIKFDDRQFNDYFDIVIDIFIENIEDIIINKKYNHNNVQLYYNNMSTLTKCYNDICITCSNKVNEIKQISENCIAKYFVFDLYKSLNLNGTDNDTDNKYNISEIKSMLNKHKYYISAFMSDYIKMKMWSSLLSLNTNDNNFMDFDTLNYVFKNIKDLTSSILSHILKLDFKS